MIEIEPGVLIPAPSLAGLVILKLFAWLDRRDTRDIGDEEIAEVAQNDLRLPPTRVSMLWLLT